MATQDGLLHRRCDKAVEVLERWRKGETLTPEQILAAQVGLHAVLDRMASEALMERMTPCR